MFGISYWSFKICCFNELTLSALVLVKLVYKSDLFVNISCSMYGSEFSSVGSKV